MKKLFENITVQSLESRKSQLIGSFSLQGVEARGRATAARTPAGFTRHSCCNSLQVPTFATDLQGDFIWII